MAKYKSTNCLYYFLYCLYNSIDNASVLFYTALSIVQNTKHCINTMRQPTSSSFQHGEHHHL